MNIWLYESVISTLAEDHGQVRAVVMGSNSINENFLSF